MKIVIVLCALIAVTLAATHCDQQNPCTGCHAHQTPKCEHGICICEDDGHHDNGHDNGHHDSGNHHPDGKRQNHECHMDSDCAAESCHGHSSGNTPHCIFHGHETHGHHVCGCKN